MARLKDASQHETREIPELRIIDDALWERVRARQAVLAYQVAQTDTTNRLNGSHRRRFLLSGLLKCGCCGGGFTIIGPDRYGCATRRSRGTCDNSKTISRQHIEARVLVGLKDRLLAPDMVTEALAAYEAEAAAVRRNAVAASSGRRRELEDVERKLAGIVRAIEDGAWSDVLRARLAELEGRRAKLQQELAAAEAPSVPEVRLHPGVIEHYRDQVASLEVALADEAIRGEAEEALRALIERVELRPDETAADGMAAVIHGDLAVIRKHPVNAATRAGYAVVPGFGGASPASRRSSMICLRLSMPSWVKAVTPSSPTP